MSNLRERVTACNGPLSLDPEIRAQFEYLQEIGGSFVASQLMIAARETAQEASGESDYPINMGNDAINHVGAEKSYTPDNNYHGQLDEVPQVWDGHVVMHNMD